VVTMFLETESPPELQYASCVARKRNYGYHVRDPYPEEAISAIRHFRPGVIWFVGHGLPHLTTLKDRRLFISTSTPEDVIRDLFYGTVVVAVSCHTAKELGHYVARYAHAYFGATDAYYFIMNDEVGPCPMGTVEGVRQEVLYNALTCAFEPTLVLVDALSAGCDVDTAYRICKRKFDEFISYFESLSPQSDAEKSLKYLALYVLSIDKSIWVMVKGVSPPRYTGVSPLITILQLAGVFGVGMVFAGAIYPEKIKAEEG